MPFQHLRRFMFFSQQSGKTSKTLITNFKKTHCTLCTTKHRSSMETGDCFFYEAVKTQ